MLVPQLRAIQERFGYLPKEEIERLAARLDVRLHRIHEIISFFPHFRREPPPDVEVHVCRDIACHSCAHYDGQMCLIEAQGRCWRARRRVSGQGRERLLPRPLRRRSGGADRAAPSGPAGSKPNLAASVRQRLCSGGACARGSLRPISKSREVPPRHAARSHAPTLADRPVSDG